MHWLLIGYMFLFIHRPFEVWPWLGDLRIERIYMGVILAFWLVLAPKRFLPNFQHFAYAGLATAVVAAWALSPWSDYGQPGVEDWLKILVFYMLMVTTVFDERGLKRIVVGFMLVMAVYLLHSLREYLGGRHTYRMGIARMIGVDSTMGDPNSFGASIVFSLPFIAALWRAEIAGRFGKLFLLGYFALAVVCILLTGSRSSLLGLLVWSGLMAVRSGRRWWLWALILLTLAPGAYFVLPESLQNRFETIVNPDAGPKSAQESGQGRIEGLYTGLTLWGRSPLSGVGPGAWRPATGSSIESHNLYGQLLGETGLLGLIGFSLVLIGFWMNLRRMSRIRKMVPEWSNDLIFQTASAVSMGVGLLLFMGMFGHNLFRYSWLWYGGFLVIARYCADRRLRQLQQAEAEWDEYGEYPSDESPDQTEIDYPAGWDRHAGHPSPGR